MRTGWRRRSKFPEAGYGDNENEQESNAKTHAKNEPIADPSQHPSTQLLNALNQSVSFAGLWNIIV
jgi:hypothetical protein